MNRAICEAIRKKAVIQFKYGDGEVRIVEPQCHGISTTGKEVFRGFQTSGHSNSRQSRAEKLFEVSKISGLKETGKTFSRAGPHFNPHDQAMASVHCFLREDKTISQRRGSIKSIREKKKHPHAKLLPYGEIKKQYPNEWVLVEFSKLDSGLHPKKGQVLAHAPNKEDIYKALLQTRGKNVSVEYFGPLPKDLAVMFCLVATR